MVNICQGVQYSVPSCMTFNPMELPKVIIHLAKRHTIFITNVNLPPHYSDYSSNHQNNQSWLNYSAQELDLITGDFNACQSPKVIISLQTSRAHASQMDGNTIKGSSKQQFQNACLEVRLKCFSQSARCLNS